MSNYSLLFYAKKTKGNPEFSTIYLRLTVNGKRTELSTGQTIQTSSWNSEAGKVSGNGKEANSLIHIWKISVSRYFSVIMIYWLLKKKSRAKRLKIDI